jgi:hypothetical protein
MLSLMIKASPHLNNDDAFVILAHKDTGVVCFHLNCKGSEVGIKEDPLHLPQTRDHKMSLEAVVYILDQ